MKDFANLLLALTVLASLVYVGYLAITAILEWNRTQSDFDEEQFSIAEEEHPKQFRKPSESFPVHVRSFSDPSEVYGLDPSQCRCTCPDWNKRRGGFPVGDPRRMCKHLVRLWSENKNGFPEHLEWYADELRFRYGIGNGVSPHTKREDVVLASGGIVEMYRDDQNEWINIFDGRKRYAFNPDEMRWAYENEPKHSREIVKAILGVGPDLLPGCIKTVARRPATEKDITPPFVNRSLKGCIHVAAEVEGVGVTALINPRAGWQNMLIDGLPVDLNVKDGRINIPPRLMHLELALTAWVEEEYGLARKNWKNATP